MIEINKEIIFQELIKLIDIAFSLPETCAVKIRDIVIEKIHNKDYMLELIKNAVELSYHDVFSASVAYDKLTLKFYPQFKERREILFAIWDCYEKALSI